MLLLSDAGAPDYQDTVATDNAQVVTIGSPNTPTTTKVVDSMSYSRAFCNSVALPNGKVLNPC